MECYYNEWEPYAAQWLRNLSAASLITPGTVDERDVRKLEPDELRPYTRCHFFAGLGGWDYALQLADWPLSRPVWTASLPCQPFSGAGKRQAQADDRHLWPHFFRLVRECRPELVVGEQVSGAIGLDWLDGVCTDLEAEGYLVGAVVLGAHSVGAPHIRQRLYWVAHCQGERNQSDAPRRSRRQAPQPNKCGTSSGMAHTEGDRHAREQAPRGRRAGVTHSSGLEQSSGDRRDERGTEPSGRSAASGRSSSGLGDPDGERRDGQPVRLPERGPHETGVETSWSGADLIPCLDGKTRLTIPAALLLAHGFPADLGILCPSGAFPQRAAMLAGFGNAIIPQVAAEFLRTVMELVPA